MIALFVFATLASGPLDCTYQSRTEREIVTERDCGTLDPDGQLRLTQRVRAALRFERGLASVHAGAHWYYVRRDGRSAPVVQIDNWAADFSEGRVASPRGGKIGYVDRALTLVIPARYDWGFPFAHGKARICIGCVAKSDGEHTAMLGGQWRCIDRMGRELARKDCD